MAGNLFYDDTVRYSNEESQIRESILRERVRVCIYGANGLAVWHLPGKKRDIIADIL